MKATIPPPPPAPVRPQMFIVREGLIGFFRDIAPKNRNAKR